MSLSLSVLSQSGPPKSVGGGGGVVGGRGGGGGGGVRIPHFNWSIYRGSNFFFFLVPKVRNVRLGVFSGGGCHHPNSSE